MRSPTAEVTAPVIPDRNVFGVTLFMAIFLFLLITIDPYVDLTGAAILDPSAENSNRLNQIITLLIFGGMLINGLQHSLRSIILRPRWLHAAIFGWFLFTALLSNHPFLGIKALILAIIVQINASIFLLLPSSERQFAKLLATGTLIMLGIAYFGVILMPEVSIHQASELREPMNAGFWRGHFPHKNVAAGAMVIASFFGFFVMSVWSRGIGLAILALSCFFLIHTGGKSASAMLPAVLILAWLFERFRVLRIPIAVGGVATYNLLAVGPSVIRPLGEFVSSLGIDATFTNRADIWRFAFSAISEKPITGYGLKGFWQTSELVHSGGTVETWAVQAYNGHNGYLDILLHTGIPGLILTLILVLFLPLRDLNRRDESGMHSNMTRLFVRIWLYALFNAGLESIFFNSGSLLWFIFVVALYAFRLRSENLVSPTAEITGAETGVKQTR
ncbi:O-antigen ligase family protein [Sinorhizobium numidicum]|uniref:O-antigen ligase family protein n=1 Tax=Sinorhizobium numidicum TaxID=680248 RepID=A0ABY8CN75_9HYPH|nr:O-antigen ligase [Sinorhizobium numidicum]WEX74131.1 O-antigen ligase family protein [Sinorhizobium numidicum]WEX80116.1 O-antigen ligase family protein [Sinorhizobium numidicum]